MSFPIVRAVTWAGMHKSLILGAILAPLTIAIRLAFAAADEVPDIVEGEDVGCDNEDERSSLSRNCSGQDPSETIQTSITETLPTKISDSQSISNTLGQPSEKHAHSPLSKVVLPESLTSLYSGPPSSDWPRVKRESAIPSKIVCGVVVKLDEASEISEGSSAPTQTTLPPPSVSHSNRFLIDWQDRKALKDSVSAAERILERSVGPGFEIYCNSTHYCILRTFDLPDVDTWKGKRAFKEQKHSSGSAANVTEIFVETIDKDPDWSWRLQSNLAKHLQANEKQTIYLQICVAYTKFKPHDSAACCGRECASDAHRFLWANRIKVKDDKWFLPGKLLHKYFNKDLIGHLVRQDPSLKACHKWTEANETNEDECEKFINFIDRSALRLFASALVERRDLRFLYWLWKTDDPKDDTTISRDDYNTVSPVIEEIHFEHILDSLASVKAHQFKEPIKATGEGLPQYTWETRPRYELIDKNVVLPILYLEQIGTGGSGTVHAAKIHSDHHGFGSNKDEVFALKEIPRNPNDRDRTHENEGDILGKIAIVPHQHICRMLGSWSQGDKCSILMPKAVCNLGDFLRMKQSPRLDHTFITWFFAQIEGLAAAVRHIHHTGPARLSPLNLSKTQRTHESSGYHHDLKPKNVLVFEDDVLRISDFGTARLEQVAKNEGTSHATRNLSCDPGYMAPDYIVSGKASRPQDVFSLGCIFLEMLAWAFNHDVATFEAARATSVDPRNESPIQTTRFWYCEQNQITKDYTIYLKQVVVDMFQKLRSDCEGFQVFEQLLTTIEDMMRLNTTKTKDSQGADIEGRINIKDALETLHNIGQEALLNLEANPDFFLLPKGHREDWKPMYGDTASSVNEDVMKNTHLQPSDAVRTRSRSLPGVMSPLQHQDVYPNRIPSASNISIDTEQLGGQFASESTALRSSPVASTPSGTSSRSHQHVGSPHVQIPDFTLYDNETRMYSPLE